MRRLISFATAALVLFMIAGCQRAAEPLPIEAVPIPVTSSPVAGAPPSPSAGARNIFDAYSTGVEGVAVLVDRDTGCEFVATSVANTGGASVAAGYTSIIERPAGNASLASNARKCRLR